MPNFGSLLRRGLPWCCLWAMVLVCAPGQAETLVFKDGSSVTGQIVEETGEKIVLKVKFGQATYAKAEIVEVKGRAGEGGEARPAEAGPKRDELVMKSGVTHRGLLVEETATEVVFDLIQEGVKVSKRMVVQTRFPRAEVEELKKLGDAEREAARKQLQDASNQEAIEKVEERSIEILPTTWLTKGGGTKPAKKIELEHFIIESNDKDEWLKKCAGKLSRVCAAYKQYFGADRNPEKKVRVILLSSMAEYYAALDHQMMNPAFYDVGQNRIMAGCDVSQWERGILAVKGEIARVEAEIAVWRMKAADARSQMNAEVRKAEDQIFKKGRTTPEGQALWENIKAQQRAWQMQIGKADDQVKAFEAKLAPLQQSLDVVFQEVTKEMLKTLYHEGFHAFAHNFLFDEPLAAAVPRWLHEGLAQYFENARVENNRLVLGQEDREKLFILRKWHKEGKLAPLAQLAAGDQKDYMVHTITNLENSTRHYLQAWLVTYWLGAKGRLTKNLLLEYAQALKGGQAPLEALSLLTGVENGVLQDEMDKKLSTSIEKGR